MYYSLIIVILAIISLLCFIQTQKNEIVKKNNNVLKGTYYTKKKFMTDNELSFYYKLARLEKQYKIVPQINLATIINKYSNQHYQNELFRNIDFAIFSLDYSKLLLLIELNDNTHKSKERKSRDIKVKKICNEAGIKLITFYSRYPNEEEYVINRIIKEINDTNNV